MSEPLIFVFTYEIKEGHLEDYEKHIPDLMSFVDENEPRLIAFNTYINDEGTEATTVLIQPDTDAQEHHMHVASEKLNEGYQFVDFTKMRIEVCGPVSERILETLRGLEESGVPVHMQVRHIDGVNRLPAL